MTDPGYSSSVSDFDLDKSPRRLRNFTPMKIIIESFIAVLVFVGLSAAGPKAQAVIPAPDGGYPGFNTAEGQNALFSLTTGVANTAVGWFSLWGTAEGSFNTATGTGSLLFNTADENTAFGAAALLFNTTGDGNTAIGAAALLNNTTGFGNTANGFQALNSNTTGSLNTANGIVALFHNTEGNQNTANGFNALFHNTEGSNNTANGVNALFSNTTGNNNTATGFKALQDNTIGHENTANGVNALFSNTTGIENTAIGYEALNSNTEGDANMANGYQALLNSTTGVRDTANGFKALMNTTTGSFNTALGAFAGGNVTTADDVICIGDAVAGENVSHTTWIGNIYGIPTISGTTQPVIVSNTGQLGTISSAARFKKEIKPMDRASEAILALEPVTFHYKSDRTGTPQFGLIAEEVAEVNPDLVVRDEKGEIYTVRYDAVNAMLLNEFLKEHKAFLEERHKVEKLENTVAGLLATVKEQGVLIQKVNARLELRKPAAQTVVNNR